MVRASISHELIEEYARRLGVELEYVNGYIRVVGDPKYRRKQAMYQHLYRRLIKQDADAKRVNESDI